MNWIWKSFFGVVFLVCSSTVFSQDGKGETEKVEVNVVADKPTYLPSSPVTLIIEVKNEGKRRAVLVYDDAWPPPWQRNQTRVPEVSDDFVDEVMINGATYQVIDLHGKVVYERKFPDAQGGLLDPRLPPEKLLTLKPGETKHWSVELPVKLDAPGKYIAQFRLPKLKRLSASGEERLVIEKKIALNVLSDKDALGGAKADVKLILPEGNKPAPLVLKWTLTPPEGKETEHPQFMEGNCRVLVRNDKGDIIHELFWNPSGQRVPRGEKWRGALEWELPLNARTFGFSAKLFPSPGNYTIEAAFRDFVGAEARDGAALQLGYSPFYIPEKDREKPTELMHKLQKETKPPVVPSTTGQWIAFRKTFNLQI